MVDTVPANRPQMRRKPLNDASYRANIGVTATPDQKKGPISYSSPVALTHHESLMATGPLTTKNTAMTPEDKRMSALTNEIQYDSKRNSQVSTTSTTASSKGRRRKTHIGPWQLGVELGKGGCGRVRKVRHALTGQEAAAKIISKKVAEQARAQSLANLDESSAKYNAESLATRKVMPFGVEREVVIMKLLEHPNVVRLYDVWENSNELYLIMEYVEGGELFEHVEKSLCLGEDETVWYFRQVIAALLHCHRLGIHHRDLKPENILLEKETSNIKLVDFGMAALQPRGKLLTTPCGSIHYAAPDVLERSYDGSKADVWSCGIILYVMLTGNTPFQYDPTKDVSVWYRTLRAGQIPFPDELSVEAKDLIQRILVPDANRRISLEAVWNHPLLHKYDKLWGLTEEKTVLDKIIGPKPVIREWSLTERKDIDREILRNLKTLWHSEKESTLVEKLLNKEGNLEKYFYSALQKHREEQLENFVGFPDGVSYSTSDHHHIALQDAIPPVPSLPVARAKSQFSIMGNEHLQSKSSLHGPSPSIGSYDPYRASKDAIIGHNSVGYSNITVHRESSRLSRKQSSIASQRNMHSLRMKALKTEHQSPLFETPTSVQTAPKSRRSSIATKRTLSRVSLGASIHSNSKYQPGVVRPKTPYKRGVQFGHYRKSSATSGLSTRASSIANMPLAENPTVSEDVQYWTSSPEQAMHQESLIRSRKATVNIPATKYQNGRTNSQVIESEARKVSTELEMFCEQAFFRYSAGSSAQTSKSDRVSSYDTPASSISQGPSPKLAAPSKFENIQRGPSYSSRPLPELPLETPNSFIARELAETRKRLVSRYADDDPAKNQTYKEILAHLDALLDPGTMASSMHDSKRVISAPEQRPQGNKSILPIISEEGKTLDTEDVMEKDLSRGGQRATTDPTTRTGPYPWNGNDLKSTIRVISPPSLPQVAPLNIRKRSSDSVNTKVSATVDDEKKNHYPYHTGAVVPGASEIWKNQSAVEFLDTISEETIRGSAKVHHSTISKKKSWFWKKAHPSDVVLSKDEAPEQIPTNGNLKFIKTVTVDRFLPKSKPWPGDDSSPQIHQAGPRNGLRSLLGKRHRPKQHREAGILTVHDGSNSNLGTDSTGRDSSQRHTLDPQDSEAMNRDVGMQRSWLARFLNIKPVTKITCLQIGRGRVRQDLFRLLKSWRAFGIRDIRLDRMANVISARLDQRNHLQLKEIVFTAELFVVLQGGRRANLTLVRFTQRKGAASSFHRVIEGIEMEFQRRGALIEDKAMCREMCDILG